MVVRRVVLKLNLTSFAASIIEYIVPFDNATDHIVITNMDTTSAVNVHLCLYT